MNNGYKIILKQLADVVKKTFDGPYELHDRGLKQPLEQIDKLLNSTTATDTEIEDAIFNLYENVPQQTDDADWWPLDLWEAMNAAKNFLNL